MRPESGDPNDCPEASPLMRSKVRAYSHQGHGPRADQQAGYISATSDTTSSLAKRQPVHTFGSTAVDANAEFEWLGRVEDRDRGTPRGATPPTPPGIRVTYPAVRLG